jgi:hypothetical protein
MLLRSVRVLRVFKFHSALTIMALRGEGKAVPVHTMKAYGVVCM